MKDQTSPPQNKSVILYPFFIYTSQPGNTQEEAEQKVKTMRKKMKKVGPAKYELGHCASRPFFSQEGKN